ncbi:hypothetical protein [Kutzneria chonburiensis]|uniref:Uncharacterized protein n=1 Tax=Kutzneria chonburiensis TaxID=1483604 RepID=A0ABV6MKC7_9PSEU|nr:hypothetical protein [Kutzneria chonburiensis]
MTAFPARSLDPVAGLRSAVDATLTELLSAQPEPDRVCPGLSSALAACAYGETTDLGDAPSLLRAAVDHAWHLEFAEARMLLVAGQHVLRATAKRRPLVIPARRDPVSVESATVPTG